MAPKSATKEKVVKGDEAEELILQYLKAVNRPYGSADVAANLKGKVTKLAAQKAMQTLHEKGLLTMKPYGKQTIFVYPQDQLSTLSADEMRELDAEIKSTSVELDGRRKELRGLQSDVTNLEALPKTKALGSEIDRIKLDNDKSLKALTPLRGADGEGPKIVPMSADETKKIDDMFNRWRKEWVDRRKVYKELLGFFQDGGLFQSASEFEDEQGINVDDEESNAVEKGEFCRPPANRSIKQTRPPPISKPAITSVKRANTDTSEEEQPKPKKWKKA